MADLKAALMEFLSSYGDEKEVTAKESQQVDFNKETPAVKNSDVVGNSPNPKADTFQNIDDANVSKSNSKESTAVSENVSEAKQIAGESVAAEQVEKSEFDSVNPNGPTTPEQAQVTAPLVPDDVTVVTSDDMMAETLEMRLSTFWHKQEELEQTVQMLLSELNLLKGHFSTINSAIEFNGRPNKDEASFEQLINRI
jgi:hypothetical protein